LQQQQYGGSNPNSHQHLATIYQRLLDHPHYLALCWHHLALKALLLKEPELGLTAAAALRQDTHRTQQAQRQQQQEMQLQTSLLLYSSCWTSVGTKSLTKAAAIH
jgi:hypothetical protein